MLRYKTETRPVLVALYDIRPGNGPGQFLQPWSPHGATRKEEKTSKATGLGKWRQLCCIKLAAEDGEGWRCRERMSETADY